MTWHDLGDPRPLDRVEQYVPYSWPKGNVRELPVPDSLPTTSFVDVVSSRRTRRVFNRLSVNQLSQLLWLSCRCQEKGDLSLGFPIELHPVSSAGAIHPIHVLIFETTDQLLWRYNPDNHELISLNGTSHILEHLKNAAEEVLPLQQTTVMVFVAEPGKTFAKYRNASSLIWRDAGVLLGHLGLVSESLGINFCPLGITGEPWSSRLDTHGNLVGVGLALLGSSD